MKRIKNSRSFIWITLILVFVLNVLQGAFTELLPDEAYYWVYSQKMDLGYFDHPPMVSVYIYLSDLLFTDEMGVRFFSAISFSILIYIVWKTIDHPKKEKYRGLFLLLILSTVLLNVYGFITTPDTPLVLFSALFFYAYQHYLTHKNSWSYILLSVSIAGMMYSKYQGLLVVLFILISNRKLLRDYKLYIMALGALLLYAPHLYWQFENDFPSIRYHLFERVSNRRYKPEQTIMHVVNMLAIIGFTFPIVYKAFFKNLRSKNTYQRGLNFIVVGFFVFFFISSFRGRTQAQWIVPISVPLILITFDHIIHNLNSRKWFVRLAVLTLIVTGMARLFLVSESLSPIPLDFHGNEKWTKKLQNKTKGQQKVFINSFQNVATYWFYTREKAFYMKNFLGRNNHFTLLQKDENISSKDAVMISRIRFDHTDYGIHIRGKDSIFITQTNHFRDLSHLKIKLLTDSIVFHKNTEVILPVQIQNSSKTSVDLSSIWLHLGFLKHQYMEVVELKASLNISSKLLHPGEIMMNELVIRSKDYPNRRLFRKFAVGIQYSNKIDMIRASKFYEYSISE